MVVWLREVLKFSTKTSVSWSEQTLSTWLATLSGPETFRELTLARFFLILAEDSDGTCHLAGVVFGTGSICYASNLE